MKRLVLIMLVAPTLTLISAWLPAAIWRPAPATNWWSDFELTPAMENAESRLPSFIRTFPHESVTGYEYLGPHWAGDILDLSFNLVRKGRLDHEATGTLRAHRFGWPWRSMQYSELGFKTYDEPAASQAIDLYAAYFKGIGTRQTVMFPSWFPSLPNGQPRRVPLEPMFAGFFADTAAYGTALWLIFFVPGLVRARLRLRRGLCPRCAYPVGISPVCTECGKPVRPRSGAPA